MIRLATALFIAFMLLPSANPGEQRATIEVSTFDGLSAAKSVYDDLSGFCDRNHETCVTGKLLLDQLEAKARESLGVLSAKLEDEKPVNSDATLTGSIN